MVTDGTGRSGGDRHNVRVVGVSGNERVWSLLGAELPTPSPGRPRDPYLEQGCHPDVVTRLWQTLNQVLPVNCRGQAKGRPVLAHPDTGRIFAFARGTQYALWITAADRHQALALGLSPVMRWSDKHVTDLAPAGQNWLWGGWCREELDWVGRACDAAGSGDRQPGQDSSE